MGEIRSRQLRLLATLGFALSVVAYGALAQETQDTGHRFELHSKTFANDSFLPIGTIHNVIVNGKNACSINGAEGGNESPQLYWTGAPEGTRSFVVVLYDVTAAFTHWGMYNISASTTELPQNAGVSGSRFGQQIVNDFFIGAEYDGPCPPANVPPDVHHYVFTVYALDIELCLPSSTNFPANAETLYQALIKAGEERHILASARLVGLYSTTK